MRGRLIAIVVLSLLAACGSDGPAAQPEDEFLDAVEAHCRAATKEVDKLDLSGDGTQAVDDYVEIISTAHEEIEDLDPPNDLKKDFDNFIGDLGDQIKQGDKLVGAIDDGDQTAITDEFVALSDLTVETDNAAKALGALRCKGIFPDESLIGLDAEAVPEQTIPVDTTPDTVPEETTADTTEDTTDDTTTPDTVAPLFSTDLSTSGVAPPGYTWVTDFVQTDVNDLYSTSVLGPLVTSYEAGQIINDGGGTASIFITRLSTPWTDDAIDQWLFWEHLNDGTESVTPAGVSVTVMPEAFPDTDCLGHHDASFGIALCTFSGVDGKPILDAYLAANPG